MKFVDYYKILGVKRTSSSKEIRDAYYRLARKYHPDKSGNSKSSLDKFLLINTAYRIIGNLENRLIYNIELENHEISILSESE